MKAQLIVFLLALAALIILLFAPPWPPLGGGRKGRR